MTNEWHLFYGHIVDESSKVGHHWLIEVGVILTFILIDQVEIPHKKPWPMTLPSDVSELLEESYLLLGTLQLINTCEPPWLLAARAELNRDRKIVNPHCSRRSQSLSPSHKYPSTSPNQGQGDEICVEVRAQHGQHQTTRNDRHLSLLQTDDINF
jgi:hypothetical protein